MSSALLRQPSLLIAVTILRFVTSFAFSLEPNRPTAPSLKAAGGVIPVLYDSSNHLHRDLRYHPEQPARIDACVDALLLRGRSDDEDHALSPIADVVDVAPEPPPANDASSADGEARTGDASAVGQNPRSALLPRREPLSPSELDRARSLLVGTHSEEYVSKLERRCVDSRQRRIDEGKNSLGFVGYVDEGDTFLTTESYGVCLRATAAWARGVDLLFDDEGECDERVGDEAGRRPTKTRAKAAVALTRPPGHHATTSYANGFCLFNFAAAAAYHALSSGRARRVSLLDWDVHYGQGVAEIVGTKAWGKDCRYVSLHQVPAFPYEGQRRGVSGNFRNVLTIPMQCDSSWTCGYKDAFEDRVLPFVCGGDDDDDDREEWHPDLVIVCAGYDALDSDELASMSLTAVDYGTMTRLLRKRVGPDTKILVGLEGGYQLKEGAAGGNLADAVVETVQALAEYELSF